MTDKEIGDYIKLHMEIQGKTQVDATKEAGVSMDAINRLCNGRKGTGEGVRQKVANWLGLVIPSNIIPEFPHTLLQEKLIKEDQ